MCKSEVSLSLLPETLAYPWPGITTSRKIGTPLWTRNLNAVHLRKTRNWYVQMSSTSPALLMPLSFR
jgi:hypothetical protein